MSHQNPPILELDRFLVTEGVFGRVATGRQQILGCAAYHFNQTINTDEPPRIFGSQIANCTGMQPTPVADVLRKLERADILLSAQEERDHQRRGVRRYYTPNIETEVGQHAFKLMSASFAVCTPSLPPAIGVEETVYGTHPSAPIAVVGSLHEFPPVWEAVNTAEYRPRSNFAS